MMSIRGIAALTAVSFAVAGGAALAAGPPGAAGRSASVRNAVAQAQDPARTNLSPLGQTQPISRPAEKARSDLRGSLGRQAVLTTDARTGGVKAVGKLDGFLTGRSSASAAAVALGYVRSHSDAFGLTSDDLSNLKLVRDYTSPDGVRHLQWAQVVDGFTVADSSLVANVAGDGRLVNVGGGIRGGLKLNRTQPSVSSDSAYASTLRSVGSNARVPAKRSARSSGTRATAYSGSGAAKLVAVTAGDGLRLAWRVLAPAGRDGDYDSLVDATTGRLVRRANLVKFANALAADNFPGAPVGGTQETKDITPWLFPGADTLSGNNAHSFLDVNDVVKADLTEDTFTDENVIPASGEVHPSSGNDWLYPIHSVADATGDCPPAPGCTWNHNVPNSWQTNKNEATTQLFYFVNKFHDHLLDPAIGFDEASGNFQVVNVSGRGKGNDPVWAQADDGANTHAGLPDGGHIDNANFDPRPDGTMPGRMQMYLFKAADDPRLRPDPFAAVNGSDDPSVVYHEYTHGLSNRLIIDSQGFGALGEAQSGAMGEAWSDWYALDFLAQQGLITDTDAVGDIREGGYVDNDGNVIRSEPIDCPPGADNAPDCPGSVTHPGGYTYQDFGQVAAGAISGVHISEVHGDGEIWVQTLWQLRQRLVAQYGQVDGSKRAEALVTGGMRLGPPSPSFLDQRNAILQQDVVQFGGADLATIWDVFAQRGMGYFASTKGDFDLLPDADFSTPPAAGSPTGTIRGVITDDQSQPVQGALVGLGGHDGPPAAGPALQAISGADGSYSITGVPQAQYPQLTVDAPRGLADAFTGPVTVDGATTTKDVAVRRNYAFGDKDGGATITSDARNDAPWGCGWGNLIDGNEGTVLETADPVQDDPSTAGDETKFRTFTVTLSAPVTGPEVWIDPSGGCGLTPFSGLSAYDVLVSTDGTTFTRVASGAFDFGNDGKLNKVPLNLNGVTGPVTAVRLVAKSTQGQDPLVPIGDAGTLDIAELQVYGRPGGTPPAGGGGGGTPTPGTARLRPVLSHTKHKIKVNRKSRKVAVKVRCIPASAGVVPKTCSGRLTLSGGKKGRRALSTRRFTIAADKTVTIHLKVTRKAARLLRKRRIETKLRASVANPGAGTRRASWPVRVSISKAKKKGKK